jgi:hypothetical protein
MNSTSYESAETIRQHSLAQAIKALKEIRGWTLPAAGQDANWDDAEALLRQCEIDAPSDNVKSRYPDFINELSSAHARSTANTFGQEARARGIKDNIQTRRIIASIGTASLRMGMVLGALMREKGVDPIEVLLRHAEAQTRKTGAAHELRMVENAYDQYTVFLDGLLEQLEAPAAEPDAGTPQE